MNEDLIWKMIGIRLTNAKAIIQEHKRGIGIYPLFSLANHDCNPSAQVEIDHENFNLVLRARRDVRPGEEVSISYLPLELKKFREKQLIFKRSWKFECQCEDCSKQTHSIYPTDQNEVLSLRLRN